MEVTIPMKHMVMTKAAVESGIRRFGVATMLVGFEGTQEEALAELAADPRRYFAPPSCDNQSPEGLCLGHAQGTRLLDQRTRLEKGRPGRLPSPARPPEEHPIADDDRRSCGRVWHRPQEMVDVLLRDLAPMAGFTLSVNLAEVMAHRVVHLVGPEAVTYEEARESFFVGGALGSRMTYPWLLDRVRNIATYGWVHATEGRR